MTTSRAMAIVIVRTDGVVLGFTDHDADIVITRDSGGLRCKPSGGFDASSLEQRTGAAVDAADLVGAITDDRITAPDIRAGRYDGATVERYWVDWRTGDIIRRFADGVLGEIEHGDVAFTVEVRDAAATILDRSDGRVAAKSCPFVLGNALCGVDLNTRAIQVRVTLTNNADWFFAETLSGDEVGASLGGDWPGGLITFADGRTGEIAAREGGRFRLFEPISKALDVGVIVRLTPGCAKTAAACKTFGNIARFGGFPHIPGADFVAGYANREDENNGGSLFHDDPPPAAVVEPPPAPPPSPFPGEDLDVR